MPRDEFKETIKLIFESDKASLSEVEKEVENLSKLNVGGITSRKFEEFKQFSQEYNRKLSELRELENIPGEWAEETRKAIKDWVTSWEDVMGITAQREEEERKKLEEEKLEKEKAIASFAIDGYKNLIDNAIKKLKETLSDSWEELDNMLGYSLLSNAKTRSLALGYGFSASQSYGFQKAMGALGFVNEEDLMYANPQQIKLFKEAFGKYTEKYERLYDSGMFEKLLEYQVEMREFEEDLKLEFVEWFVDNKDLIKDGMNAIMTLAKTALSILSWLTNQQQISNSGAISDVISNYASNRNTNISMSNTFNGVDGSQKASLVQWGTYTVAQIKNALEQ